MVQGKERMSGCSFHRGPKVCRAACNSPTLRAKRRALTFDRHCSNRKSGRKPNYSYPCSFSQGHKKYRRERERGGRRARQGVWAASPGLWTKSYEAGKSPGGKSKSRGKEPRNRETSSASPFLFPGMRLV